MFRIGSCRPVRRALRTDFRLCHRDFHHLTTRTFLCSNSLAVRDTFLPGTNKARQVIWRENRAVHSMLLRSGFSRGDMALARVLFTNFRSDFHTSSSNHERKRNDEDEDDKKDDKKEENQGSEKFFQVVAKSLAYVVCFLMLISVFFPQQGRNTTEVSWQEFVHEMLAKGEVQQILILPDLAIARIILHENAILNGMPTRNRSFSMHIPDTETFEEKLRKTEKQLGISPANGVPIVFNRVTDSVWPTLAITVFIGFIILNLAAALTSKNFMSKLQMPWSSFTKAKFTLVDPRMKAAGKGVKFDDIAGLKEAKIEVMEFVDYLKKQDIYKNLGAKVPKGTLLLGPPGCGKTLLAKAVANEGNVPFLSMNGTEFIEVVGGLGASRVRDLFKEARRRAPCIVYIDEIDAIGGKRTSEFGDSEKVQTLLQLLIEMDGMSSNEGVIMLASTNRSEVLDEALLRPGRFDRHILIAQPTLIERKEIFEVYLNKLQLDNPATSYSGRLAQLTPGYSGADIANICNEAALHAAGLNQKKITSVDLEYAVGRVKYGREKKDRTIRVDERRQIAYYQAGRTIVGWMLKHTDALMKVSVIQYTSGVGHMQHFRPANFLTFKEELHDRMTMHLGGKAAELVMFHQNSTQAGEDLKKVTNVAYNMITQFGMNNAVGEVAFPAPEQTSKRFYSKKLQGIIDFEARKLIAECFISAETIIKQHSDKLTKIAEELLKRESLTYDEICELIGPPPFGHKSLVDMIEFGAEANAATSDTQSARAPPPAKNNSKEESSN